MAVVTQNGRPPLGVLLRELAEGSVGLVRTEVRLARLETVEAVDGISRGSALVAGAAVLALLGALAVLCGAILLIGDQWLPRDLYWLAALVVALIAGGIAAWFVRQGLTLLSPASLMPDETVTTLTETKNELVAAVRH